MSQPDFSKVVMHETTEDGSIPVGSLGMENDTLKILETEDGYNTLMTTVLQDMLENNIQLVDMPTRYSGDYLRAEYISPKLEAGGKGSGWTTEEGHVSHKVKLAKEAVQGKTKEQFNIKMQVTAETNEKVLSKVLGGKSYNDTEPVDILVRHAGRLIGIEVKTLLFQTSDKITMNHGAIPRKLKWQRKTGAELYTVAIDARNPKKTVCYVRPGVGSWKLQLMKQVGSFAEVKKLLEIGSKTDELPDKLPKTKAALGLPKEHSWEKPSKALRNFKIPGSR